MELKVWVDGVQRVVCGINEQTTVQEVVIALAQATGRTGRYTLVEKWKTKEKMLPPAEHPLKVLSSWAEKAAEVQFVLRRTGASSSVSGDDKVVVPERKTHRSSLPPQFKHKQKKEAILNRKEPKRKSLDITGGGKNDTTMRNYMLSEDQNQNKSSKNFLPSSPKKALIPPVFLNQTVSSLKAYPERVEDDEKTSQGGLPSKQPASQSLSPKKKPLMPPGMRGAAKLSNYSGEAHSDLTHRPIRSSYAENVVPHTALHENANVKSGDHSKHVESVKARTEFTRLVMEQHEHVNEQNETLKALDEELRKFDEIAQRKEQSTSILLKEIASLEETMRKNEQDITNKKSLQDMLQTEDFKCNSLKSQNRKYEDDIASVTESIKDMDKQIFFLKQEIEREKSLQARKMEDKFKTKYRSAESEVRKVNSVISELLEELKQVNEDINRMEAAVHDKQAQLETLNRELRQVNLQQFIRQTGSKVTVLPPNADKSNIDVESSTSNNFNDVSAEEGPALNTSRSGDTSGVWV